MATGTIPLLGHRIQGTRDSEKKSGSFVFPNTNNRTVIVIGWSEIYVLYVEFSSSKTFYKALSAQTTRNMAFTCSSNSPIVSWTSDLSLYYDPVILY